LIQILLGRVAHLRANPFTHENALDIHERGVIAVDDCGKIVACGPKADLVKNFPDAEISDYGEAWLLPGFVDGHIHFPQYHAVAGYGRQLLDWLDRTIFPSELRFADQAYAEAAADAFVARLLAGGTTTALVFGSQFIPATRALFGAAKRRGLRLIAGPTLMDRGGPHTPPELMTTPKAAYADSAALIREIADEPKLGYAVTPRFAPSCSPAMMETCGQLLVDFPESVLQTHINENHGEIEAAVKLFPEAAHYLAIYDRFGLLGRRTVLAHSIHSSDAELAMMAERGCAVCHCADSNLYLGSGLFPMARHLAAGIRLALGTDIGAGCHFSMLGELGQVHRIQQLQHFGLTAAKLLYLATLAGAEALGLAAHTGNFEIGKDADIIVLDPARNDYLQERLRYAGNAKEALFTLLMLANPGCIAKTWVAGYSAA